MEKPCDDILRQVFDGNPAAIIVTDNRGKIIAYNTKAVQWSEAYFATGISEGSDIRLKIATEDAAEFELAWGEAVKGNTRSIVSIMKPSGGEETWHEISLRPLGEFPHASVMILITDITKNKRTIDYLAESENRLKSLLHNSTSIVMIIDAQMKISYVTNNCSDLLGYRAQELKGREIEAIVMEAERPRLRHIINNTEKESGGVNFAEIQFMKKDKTSAYFETSFTNHMENSAIKGIIINMHDTTERRHVDELMIRISRQNELILDTAKEGIFGTNTKGFITFINPFAASILGYAVEDLTGIDFRHLVTDNGFCDENHPLIEALAADDARDNIESHFFSRSGERILVEFSSSPIIMSGEKTGSVVTFKDIRRRKRFEEQLKSAKDDAEKANNAKGEFLAVMTHEIRTPMNGIMGFLEMLSMSELTEKQSSYVRTAHDNAKHLLGIINDVLDFSRIEKGKLELETIPFFPEKEFQSVAAILSVKIAEKKINFTSDIDNVGAVEGDPQKLKQVITNLLGNAVKFSPENGTISLDIHVIESDEKTVRLFFCVKDSGIGIPLHRQQAIFESFTQSDNSVSRKYGGSGLGLSISAALVKLMGGHITLESDEGKGSAFSFTLNFNRCEDRQGEDEIFPDASDYSSLRLKILVADDTPHIRELTALMLEKLGIDADFAENGKEAFEKYTAGRYDMVFLDGNMPVASGTEAAAMIRGYEKEHNRRSVPLVALSARAIKGDREKFLESGMDDYLAKPVAFSDLSKMIAKQLNIMPAKKAAKEGIAAKTAELSELLGLDESTVKKLVKSFAESLKQYTGEIRAAVESQSREAIEGASHKLKGMALSYHFAALGEAAKEMEENAAKGEIKSAGEILEKIEDECAKIRKDFL